MRTISLLLLILTAIPTGGASAAAPSEPPPAPDRVLVKFAPGAAAAEGEPVHGRWRLVPTRKGESPEAAIARLSRNPNVEAVELDRPVNAAADDPLRTHQWHLEQVQIPRAWKISRGAGVTVAVLDTGVSKAGDDLRCRRFVGEYDAILGLAGPGRAEDRNGHGTHVAGTIAQCSENGIGTAGVAPSASLMPVRVLDDLGQGFDSWAAAGISWAVSKGAKVINLSFGRACATSWPSCSNQAVNEAIAAAKAKGVVVVAATGNEGRNWQSFPANHPDVIGVTAHDRAGGFANYSNHGSGVSLSGPGGVNADRDGDGYIDGVLQETFQTLRWGYYYMAGTSMAAPHVAGAAALLRSADPAASPSAIRRALERSARDLGPAGYDTRFGHGSVRAESALVELLGPWIGLKRFRDVPRGSTFEHDIAWLAREEITKGCNPPTNDRFCPKDEVTREQMAAFLVRGLGLSRTSGVRFRDVKAGSTFAKDIDRLATAGITKGCNPPRNDLFCPKGDVTREQMAAFLHRALD